MRILILLGIFFAAMFIPAQTEAVRPAPPIMYPQNRGKFPPDSFRPPPPSHWVNKYPKRKPKNPDHLVRW